MFHDLKQRFLQSVTLLVVVKKSLISLKIFLSTAGHISFKQSCVVNFMTPGERVFVLGHDHISHVVEMLDFFNILSRICL